MADFIEVAKLEALPIGTGRCVIAEGKEVALFNVDGKIYAMENACLHQGQSLGAGKLQGNVVTCRAHGWKYNVCTGQTLHVPDYGVATYGVKVEDGKIFVDMGEEKPAS